MQARRIWITLALAVVLTGCGGDATETERPTSTTTATSPSTPTTPGTDEPTGTAGEDTPGAVTVATAESDVGTILVDGDGRTLYLFDNDQDEQSTCYDDCAANWPPLIGPADAGEGVDANLLGVSERTDGSLQVTYAGHPLYHFAGDARAGDTNGQGVGDVWWVVAPDGNAIRDSDATGSRLGY